MVPAFVCVTRVSCNFNGRAQVDLHAHEKCSIIWPLFCQGSQHMLGLYIIQMTSLNSLDVLWLAGRQAGGSQKPPHSISRNVSAASLELKPPDTQEGREGREGGGKKRLFLALCLSPSLSARRWKTNALRLTERVLLYTSLSAFTLMLSPRNLHALRRGQRSSTHGCFPCQRRWWHD